MASPILRTARTRTPAATVAALVVIGTLVAGCRGTDGNTDAAPTARSAAAPTAPTGGEAGTTGGTDGTLKFGALLPQTGNLAPLGPPELAGVNLAIADILRAGGVLGHSIDLTTPDSGDSTSNIATQAVDAMLNENVDVIIGPAASSVTLNVIDRIVNAGVLEISPSNTVTDLTHYPDHGLYFRTAPSDVLQGRVIGRTAFADGARTLGILALQDRYGTDLAAAARDTFTAAGGTVNTVRNYNPNAADFTADVQAIKNADVDAIALIGFDESATILRDMFTAGLLPLQTSGKHLYLVDGNMANNMAITAGVLDGVKGTIPGSPPSPEFRDRLLILMPGLSDYSYAAEAYDAVTLVALAAEEAHSDKGIDIAARMRDVSTDGTKCTSYAECDQLLKAGTDIDYDGASGPIEFDTEGNPTIAAMGIYQYGPDNQYRPIDFVTQPVD